MTTVAITGATAHATANAPLHDSPQLQGATGKAVANPLFAVMPPITPTAILQPAIAAAHAASLALHPSPLLQGAIARAIAHRIDFIGYVAGFTMTSFIVEQFANQLPHDTLDICWSDTAGYSWSNPIKIPLGSTGEYLKNLSAWRLGYGRNRIFRLSWSANRPTALLNVFLNSSIAET